MFDNPFTDDDEPLPDVLYKYLYPDRNDVLRDRRIRYSQPSALNDPYEGTIAVAPFNDPRFPGPPAVAAGILTAELNSPEFRDRSLPARAIIGRTAFQWRLTGVPITDQDEP